jgi:hypothetical protein
MPVPQGNITLRNLQITSTNPAVAVVLLTGGLDRVNIEHVKIDGQRAAPLGFYYEFGFATNAPVPNERQSAHGRNMTFKNIEVRNLATPGGKSAGIALVGAQNADVENLQVDGADFAFFFMPGEAVYYRAWLPQGAATVPRRITLRNINGRNLATGGAELTGAQVNTHGYLAALKLSPREQTDLMSFTLDGFSFEGARGYGVRVSGPVEIRNGRIKGSRNGIILTDECTRFDIDNVTILDSDSVGIRANYGVALWNPPRMKSGSIRNSFIAGSKASPAISMDHSDKVLIEGNRLGYRRGRDPADETVQRAGVVVGPAGNGVVARANDVATSANAPAYVLVGKGPRGNTVENPRGASNVSGQWLRSKGRDQ